MTSIIEQSVEAMRAQVGDEKVICGLSGGVDSAVAARSSTRRSAINSRASTSTPA